MSKYVQPNFIVDSSASFWRNAAFESSVYFHGSVHLNAPAASSTSTPHALVLDTGSGQNLIVKSKQLGTMALESSANFYYSSQVDTMFDGIEASIARIDSSLNDVVDIFTIIDASLATMVKKSGDTMTGTLVFSATGWTLDSQNITHIDTSAEGFGTGLDTHLPTSAAVKSAIDTAIEALTVKSWNGLTTTDNSVGLGGTLNIPTTITTSATNTLALAGLQTSVQDTPYAIVSDSAGGALKVRQLGTMAWATTTDYVTRVLFDASVLSIWTKLGNVDTSLGSIWTKLGTVDTSLGNLSRWNSVIDSSIVRIDASMNNIYGGSLRTASNGLTASAQNVKLGGTLTEDTTIVTGDFTFGVLGSMSISGDLTVDGSLTYINTAQLNVSDNIIEVNYGMTGTPPTTLVSGLKINRGSSDPYYFIFYENNDTFRVGTSATEGALPGNTQAVATRQDTPETWGIAYWNNGAFRFDTSAGFTFQPGVGLGLPVAPNMASEATALVWNGSQVGSRELGTNAFSSETYATLTYVDASLVAIHNKNSDQDASIATLDLLTYGLKARVDGHDVSLNTLYSQKLDDVSIVSGIVGGTSIYAGKSNNVALLKKIVQGAGATITEDASTITISVAGASGFVSKYSGTFDGTSGTSLSITAATHGLGVGPHSITVYDGNEQVFTGVECDATGNITLSWSTGSLSASCKYVIMG